MRVGEEENEREEGEETAVEEEREKERRVLEHRRSVFLSHSLSCSRTLSFWPWLALFLLLSPTHTPQPFSVTHFVPGSLS